ncbi:cytochrome c [Roseomonas eburnea]|uniref:Cytochrome c n=1 Tax=Neoroseomonas eburnea TaxID=1346889 RepID=A0A9X9X721_9PROT|nr:cytochrome c [Neoroseomonas eburnea]MBR0679507.1 cytochrome c [Neoroseomonas eburnea]
MSVLSPCHRGHVRRLGLVRPAGLALLLWVLMPLTARAAPLALEDGANRLTVDTATLLARPDAAEISVPADIGYGGVQRRYRAVPLASVLALLPAPPPPGGVLEAAATDGFAAQVPLHLILQTTPGGPRAWLALEEPDSPWPHLPGKQASAGPFYIVWERPEAGRISPEYWPYQLAALRFVQRPAVRWPQIAADPSLPADHPARRGQDVFTSICLACHRMNGGGSADMGPDLNRPMGPTEYFQPGALRRYLRDPASVRNWPEQKMPGFAADQISETELDALLAYLSHMAARRPAGAR